MSKFRPYTRDEVKQAAAGIGVAALIAGFAVLVYLNAPEAKPLKLRPARPANMTTDEWDYTNRRFREEGLSDEEAARATAAVGLLAETDRATRRKAAGCARP